MNSLKIKNIPLNERPIERLLNYGSDKLNNEELLAILLKTGTKEMSSKVLATKIITEIGDISNLKSINYQRLIKIKGIGKVKAATIISMIELSKRMNKKITIINNLQVNNSSIIYNYYSFLIDELQEYFYCVYLDQKKKIIKDKLLFIGTINHSIVHPREIFKEAYLLSASYIICVHNHPTGNVIPSKEDFMVTERLKEIGELLGIKVIDHIIVGKTTYYSFFENNHIWYAKDKKYIIM